MVRKLYSSLFLLLVLLLGTPSAMGQTPQGPDCNVCVCNVGGLNTDALVAADLLPLNGVVSFDMLAGKTYRTFSVLAGNVYRISTCAAYYPTPANPILDDLVMHIRTLANAVVPGECDNDGCGVSNGAAAVTFVAPASTSYRMYLYRNGACPAGGGVVIAAMNGITIQNLGPVPAPPNDEPCGAVDLGVLSGSCSTPVAGTTVGATQTTLYGLNIAPLDPTASPVPCGPGVNYTGPGGDVWYKVAVPPTGLVGIETSETSLCAGALAIYKAPLCTGAYQWITGTATGLCSIDGLFGPSQAPGMVFDAFQYGMAAGDMIYIRYWERLRNEEGEFTICAYAPQRPVNNKPCGAIALTPADPCVPIMYSTENSSPDLALITGTGLTASCGAPATGLPVNDLWFVVTVPATNNMTVTLSAGSLDDMAMAWYRVASGDLCTPPAALTMIACNNDQAAGNLMPRINSNTVAITPVLAAGEQIYVRVWNRKPGQSNYWGTFGICVTPNIPPPNNLPCGAVPLDVNFDCVLTPGTNENATTTPASFPPTGSSLGASSCAGPVVRDVWYTVQVPLDLPAGQSLEFNTEAYTPTLSTQMTIYRPTGDCSSTLALTQVAPIASSCAIAGGLSVNMPKVSLLAPSQITPGELLYIRLSGRAGLEGNFGICVRRTDPQKCGGIVYDVGGPAGNYPNSHTFTQQYCPTKPGDVVSLNFLQFDTEQNYDFLYIYNGETAAAPLLGVWSGGTGPTTITATVTAGNPQGCLFVRFTTNGSVTRPGFAFKLSCAPYIPLPPVIGDCGLQVFDPGGPASNYANNIGNVGNPPFEQTYCPDSPGEVVTLTFNSFNIESNWDKLWVFDGPTTASPIISSGNGFGSGPNTWGNGAYWGSDLIGPFSSTHAGGCLTVYFQTDPSITYAGWDALVTCGPPAPPVIPVIGGGPTVTTACGSVFVDDGNAGYYAHSGNYTRTICPSVAGELVQLTFLSFNVEEYGPTACWDVLYVYDGPTTASPLINSGKTSAIWAALPNPFGNGGYCGTSPPGPFVSSDPSGCLTFRFFSDNIVERPGWRARIDCFQKPTNDEPCPAANATLLPVSTACIPVSSTNMGATATPGVQSPGCGNYTGSDVWFRFTAPANGRVLIESFAGTLTDGAMALYSAAACPGPFNMVQCNDDAGVGAMPRIDRLCTPLVPNQQYWIRFWGNSGKVGSFSLCVRALDDGAPISDCFGAFTLCSDEPFSGSNLGSGCSNDLSAANWGCLSGGERQGNWYSFSVQNPGTLGMTLTPTGNMDLDWAIWGPYTPSTLPNSVAGTCIPTVPPKRCSNASLYRTMTANAGSPATGMGSPNLVVNSPRYSNPVLAPQTLGYDGPALPTDGWVPGINVAAGQVYLLFVDDHHLNGSTYSVDWTTTPTVLGAEVMNCTVLPVELLSFDAKPAEAHVDVLWNTATELNSAWFSVQRSADGERFSDLGRVGAAGQSIYPVDYQFKDLAPLEGLSYYRLTQVDQDGRSEVSQVVPVYFRRDPGAIEVYPNPADANIRVQFDMPSDGQVRWRITDASGRIALKGNTGGNKGRNGFNIDLQVLDAGTYLLQLSDQEGGPLGAARFVKR